VLSVLWLVPKLESTAGTVKSPVDVSGDATGEYGIAAVADESSAVVVPGFKSLSLVD
jgi:hypothetical protein